jgi:hypothetical protein
MSARAGGGGGGVGLLGEFDVGVGEFAQLGFPSLLAGARDEAIVGATFSAKGAPLLSPSAATRRCALRRIRVPVAAFKEARRDADTVSWQGSTAGRRRSKGEP